MKYLADTDWIINHLNGIEAFSRKLEESALEGLVRWTRNFGQVAK